MEFKAIDRRHVLPLISLHPLDDDVLSLFLAAFSSRSLGARRDGEVIELIGHC